MPFKIRHRNSEQEHLVSTGWASVPASRYPKVRRQVVALWVVASADWHRRLVDLVCDDRPPTQPGIVELKGNIAADRKGAIRRTDLPMAARSPGIIHDHRGSRLADSGDRCGEPAIVR